MLAPEMRVRSCPILATLPTVLFFCASASADEPAREPEVPKDFAPLVLDTGRPPVSPTDAESLHFQIHGEYQLRATNMRSFPLDASTTTINDHPGETILEDSLGQNRYLNHWLRITPRLNFRNRIELVGQVDLLTGIVAGDLAHDTFADRTPRDGYNGFNNVQPRWLYAQLNLDIAVVRVGQQPSHWGMGLLANDGDHASIFGDYRYGTIAERVLIATKPGGKDSPVTVFAAGDLVYRDGTARLTNGDHALQGVVASTYTQGENQIGIYGVYRHQTNDKTSGSAIFPYTDTIDAAVLDVAGKFVAPIAGQDGFAFGAMEAAAIFGSTNALRTAEQVREGTRTTIRSYGGAVQLGVVHRAYEDVVDPKGAKPPSAFGDLVAQVELGYASGDADPEDGTQKRFVMDSNHKVGLLLFDEVMRWQTARASSAAQDPLLSNGTRPSPGVDLLPTNGGISGAQYINPTLIFRPMSWLDLKGGMVIAQTTADVVNPYRLATQGRAVNYRGGDPTRHDLGVELDGGVEARFRLDFGIVANCGVQAGVLFPGGALANAAGESMKLPWITVARAGLSF